MKENDFYCTQLSRQNNYKLHKIQEINNLKNYYTKFKGAEWCQWGKNNLYCNTDNLKDTEQLYNKCNFKSFAFSSICCRLTRNLSRQKKATYMSSYAARALTAAASSAAVAAAEAATSTQKTLEQAYGESHGPPATAYDENLFNNTFILETSALYSSSANLYSYSASNSISSAFAISYGNLNESTATGSSTSSASLSVPSSPTSTTSANSSSPSAPFIDLAGVNVSLTSVDDWSHFYDLVLSWQGICLIAVFCAFIVITIIGNTLVILAVITTRRLKTVTNCFVMSLAVADLLVGIFVMPPAVAVHLIGSWQLGWVLCDIWISLDVLLCTASILSLCAISVDRYLAVTQPLTYSRKRRSKRLALIMILIVWVLALAITCPPILGWYEPGRRDLNECRYNQNEGYVIFSAMGSFFIPMAVMIYVYARISCVIANRHDNMTDIHVHNKKLKRYTGSDIDNELDPDLSEFDLGTGQKKQLAVRTLSNQTLAKDLQEIIAVGDNKFGNTAQCHSLLALEQEVQTSPTGKNGCYEMKRPASLKRVSTASSVITTMTSTTGTGTATAAIENPWSFTLAHEHHHQQQQPHYQQDAHPNKQMRMHTVRQQHYLTAASTPDIAPSPGNTLKPEAAAFATGSSILRPTTPQLRSHHHQHTHSYTTKSLSNRISTLKKETKTTQTLSIVVGGFIACWLPFFINYLITPFLHEDQVSSTLAKVLTWLGWFNSAINPFIYAFYSVDFRAAFWRLTCKRFFSSPSKPQFPANTMSIRR